MKNKRSMMESEYDMKDIIVIDNGTDSVKIGISGEDNPRVFFFIFYVMYLNKNKKDYFRLNMWYSKYTVRE